MKLPEDVRQFLARRFQSKHREWLIGDPSESQWPLEVPLGVPTEQAALRQVDGVRCWVVAWQNWQANAIQTSCTLSWCERRWKALGVQRLPAMLTLGGPEDVAIWIGESTRWGRAQSRFRTLTARWPILARQLPRYFDVLADYNDADFGRLVEMLDWINLNPHSNLYPRQIPVAGVDSKWLDSRKPLISHLIASIQGEPTGDIDFYQRCGLRAQPHLIRLRILDPKLRVDFDGIGDISVPCEYLASLGMRPTNVFVVENLQTGLAFDDLPGSVVIMRLGYAVDVLGQLPWLQEARCIYWGDIDTHGFAILNRARSYIPNLKTVLMDESTLLSHHNLWGEERVQYSSPELPLLTATELKLYQSLKDNTYGQQVRLEQERISWEMAWSVIKTHIR